MNAINPQSPSKAVSGAPTQAGRFMSCLAASRKLLRDIYLGS